MKKGDFVKIDYIGRLENGDIFDLTDESRKRGIPILCLDIDLHGEGSTSVRMRIDRFVSIPNPPRK